MSPLTWVALIAAGAVGAPTRYLVDGWIQDRTQRKLPWGTFIVNVSGSLLLGFIAGLVLYHGFPEAPRVVLGTGFCGAYTTFSTFTFDTVRLLEAGDTSRALLNALATLIVGVAAAAAGLAMATL